MKLNKFLLFLFFSVSSLLSFNCHNNAEIFRINSNTNGMSNTFRLGDIYQVKQTKKLNRNDFAYFKLDFSMYGTKLDSTAAERIIGLPGEHIKISKGKMWINENTVPRTSVQKSGYIVDTRDIKGWDLDTAFINQYSGFLLNDDFALVNLDSNEYKKLKTTRYLIPLRDYYHTNFDDTMLVSTIKMTLAQTDSMPSIYIPKKGDTISVPPALIKYYSSAIKQFKKLDGDRYFVNENMYFMIGDNWCGVIDSRYFGLIGEKDIIGILQKNYP